MNDRFPALLIPGTENKVKIPLWDFVWLFWQLESLDYGIFSVHKLVNAIRRVLSLELKFELEKLIENVLEVFV